MPTLLHGHFDNSVVRCDVAFVYDIDATAVSPQASRKTAGFVGKRSSNGAHKKCPRCCTCLRRKQ